VFNSIRGALPQQQRGRFERVRVGGIAGDMAIDEAHQAARVGRHVGLVRDHQHGDAVLLVQAAQQFHDLLAALGVEVAGGLVGEQNGRLADDGAGDGHALLLPAGQFRRGVLLPAAEAHRLQCAGSAAVVPHQRRLAAVEQRQFDVLLRRGARQQIEALEDEPQVAAAQPCPLVARQCFDMCAMEQVLPAAGRVQAAEDVHRGRLARAARAHDGHEFAGADVEIDALQGHQLSRAAAIDLGHCAQPDQRRADGQRWSRGGEHGSRERCVFICRSPFSGR
jgi:hypothetical protein